MISEVQVKRWLNQDENLPSPHNGPCDRADLCRYASQQCRQPLSDYPLDWKDWEATPLPAAPSRRWTMCVGWRLSLGMVFDKKSGSWVYLEK
jgi:hypothetical protein